MESISGVSKSNELIPDVNSNQVVNEFDADSFKNTLNTSLDNQSSEEVGVPASALSVKFSNHAIERMRTRGITFKPDQLRAIGEAVQKASEKGAKETLLLNENSAMIVSVDNKTVVTVMDREALKDNVFTNIDSTIVI